MAVKKTTYINAELDWAETQLVQWKAYVDANPLPALTDSLREREVKKVETRGGAALGSMAEDFLKSRG